MRMDFTTLAPIPTFVNGERVACVFPVVDGTSKELHSAEIVTVCEHSGRTWGFTQRRIFRDGHSDVVRSHSTFPAAVMATRKSCGWG